MLSEPVEKRCESSGGITWQWGIEVRAEFNVFKLFLWVEVRLGEKLIEATWMRALGKTVWVLEMSFLKEGMLDAAGFWSRLLIPTEKRMFVGRVGEVVSVEWVDQDVLDFYQLIKYNLFVGRSGKSSGGHLALTSQWSTQTAPAYKCMSRRAFGCSRLCSGKHQ